MFRPRPWRALWLLPLLACTGAAAELPARVASIAGALGVAEAGISVWVQALGSAEPVLAHRAEVPRTPASTLKLVPTFAALQALTPAYRWRTEAYALGPLEDGVLRGDLLLRGSGDPWLVAEEYWKLVRALRQTGLRRIEGDLVFDTSHFELPEADRGAFDRQPDRVYNLPPHPLLVNFNAVRFEFTPRAGGGVRVQVDPRLPNLAIDNRLRLARRGCGGYQRGIAINVVDGAAERDRVLLEGRFPRRCRRYAMTRSVLTPESYAFGLFQVLWRQLGGELAGGWRRGSVPPALLPATDEADAPLAGDTPGLIHVHRSPPLGEIVRLVNKYSNNVMTRHLQLAIGAERFGPPATPAKGRDAVREVLELAGVPLEGLVIDNPSGLSRDARISARQLGTLLVRAWDAPYMPEFVSSLALAGLDGTLRRRFAGRPEAGRMHLKTGRLDDVSAIAGYVQAADGARYAVAVLVNAPKAHRGLGEEIQDALLGWVYRRRLGNL